MPQVARVHSLAQDTSSAPTERGSKLANAKWTRQNGRQPSGEDAVTAEDVEMVPFFSHSFLCVSFLRCKCADAEMNMLLFAAIILPQKNRPQSRMVTRRK